MITTGFDRPMGAQPRPRALLDAVSAITFAFLDLLDAVLCFVYRLLDGIMEQEPTPCYCYRKHIDGDHGGGLSQLSDTLFRRSNIFRRSVSRVGREEVSDGRQEDDRRRWSDCDCHDCSAWRRERKDLLHVLVKEPSKVGSTKNVILIHGFLGSSSYWSETVFQELKESEFRLFAVDLLGFGSSPKPRSCFYTLEDHILMIEKSVIAPFQLRSFHIVAHSMGCVIAMALAARNLSIVKSITLVAPPYFPSGEAAASHAALNRLAMKRIWPPLQFGSAVMSWYEHIGRTICFVFCRHHRLWEYIIKLASGKRDVHPLLRNMTKHTHHSAWHTMHNVLCGGARSQDKCLDILRTAGVPVKIIHGAKDQTVPVDCSYGMLLRLPKARLQVISSGDHNNIIIGRESEFVRDLEGFWISAEHS